jgi:nucleoside-diphosphate-sugar epimerase
MRVVVTGASGFLGSHIARHLTAQGHEVIATGRDATRLEAAAPAVLRRQTIDLSSGTLEGLFAEATAVVHCAGRAAPWGDRSAFWQDNVTATERLIAAARRSTLVRRFVLISSPSIYFRFRDEEQLTEEFTPPAHWPTPYAQTKWVAECRVRAALELGPIILRPRAVYGPGDRAIMPRLIASVRAGLFPVPNGGQAKVDVTYIDNLVCAVERALCAPSVFEGRAFNITNGEPLTARTLLEQLFRALEMRVRLVSIPRGAALAIARLAEAVAMARPGRPEPRVTVYGTGLLAYSQTLSIAAAKESLGYAPTVSTEEGLQRYARWWGGLKRAR